MRLEGKFYLSVVRPTMLGSRKKNKTKNECRRYKNACEWSDKKI